MHDLSERASSEDDVTLGTSGEIWMKQRKHQVLLYIRGVGYFGWGMTVLDIETLLTSCRATEAKIILYLNDRRKTGVFKMKEAVNPPTAEVIPTPSVMRTDPPVPHKGSQAPTSILHTYHAPSVS